MMMFTSKIKFMITFTTIHGIDISKLDLDIKSLDQSTGISLNTQKIKNKPRTIKSWVKSLNPSTDYVVLEHTGTYGNVLLHELEKQKITVSVVSPYQSKSFMSAQGISNKTDHQAADSLARMGRSLELRIYKHPSAKMDQKKQLVTALSAMMKQKRMLENQLHAQQYKYSVNEKAKQAYEQTLETVNGQIAALEEEIASLSEQDEEESKQALALMTSVKGIGPKTALAINLATHGLDNFKRPEELSKFLGLISSSHQSGSSVRKRGGITKCGSSYVRSLLYMCARSAKKYNLACKELYNRLKANGKPHKVAMVAVMHKLVKQLFACYKSKTKFDNQYHLKFKSV